MSIDFQQLADHYGTPYYVYDFDHITKQYQELKSSFTARKSLVSYAVKANSNLSVVKHLGDLGAGADCVSIGDFWFDHDVVSIFYEINKRNE